MRTTQNNREIDTGRRQPLKLTGEHRLISEPTWSAGEPDRPSNGWLGNR